MRIRTAAYINYINSDVWREKKKIFIKKFGNVCQLCKSKGYVELHHKTYDRLGHELDSDLILLCKSCHNDEDQKRAKETRYSNALYTYARKKYGCNPDPYIEEEFDDWLRKKEGY
jgi:5-methylcytosine-specific restriction endonuclease McrA